MMHIQLTKKMIEWLNPDIIVKNTDEDMYAWHANYQIVNRKKFIVVMHDLSRFSFVLFGLKKSDFKNPEFIIYNAILHVMLNQEFPLDLIDKYMSGLTEITYGKTKDRTLVARLNRTMEDALFKGYVVGLYFEEFEQNHISVDLNEIIVGENNFKVTYYPKEKMLEYLKLL